MQKPLLFLGALAIFMMGYWIPEDRQMPVEGAKPYDWNPAAYWYVGGKNAAQKGINIFAREGTPVVASTSGWVVYSENNPQGNNTVLVLGSKWRLHRYENLEKVDISLGAWVKTGEKIGAVGLPKQDAKRPANLYYSIRSLSPQVSELKTDKPFWLEQVFYVDPHKFLTEYQSTDQAGSVTEKQH